MLLPREVPYMYLFKLIKEANTKKSNFEFLCYILQKWLYTITGLDWTTPYLKCNACNMHVPGLYMHV